MRLGRDRSRTWKRPDVAAKHTALVRTQLDTEPQELVPFSLFLEGIARIAHDENLPQPASFLDFGCGAGHYSLLLDRYFPRRFDYLGCDYSEAMVDEARMLFPAHRFVVNDVLHNTLDLDAFDMICANGLVDVVGDYRTALDTLLAPRAPFVLLNRQKLSEGRTRVVRQDAYGHASDRVLIAESELNEIAVAHGRRIVARLDREGEIDHAFLLARRGLSDN
jgi:SAM-dependent methyltransferase